MIPTRFENQEVNLLDRLLSKDLISRDFSKANKASPSINIKEDEDKFSIEIEVPGFNKDDFTIELNHKELTISSEYKKDSEVEVGRYTRKEFSREAFQRSFTLPNTVDGEKISAQYKNGVLQVDIPKREEAKPKPPKQITIN